MNSSAAKKLSPTLDPDRWVIRDGKLYYRGVWSGFYVRVPTTLDQTNMAKPVPTAPKLKYWYKTYVHYCPVCGREKRYRERVYEKPLNPYEHHEYYDYCGGF